MSVMNMNKKFILLALSVALCAAGCSDSTESAQEQKEHTSAGAHEYGSLVEIGSWSLIDPDEVVDSLYGGKLANLLNRYPALRNVTTVIRPYLKHIFTKNIGVTDEVFRNEVGEGSNGKRQWQIETYVFTYRSKSLRGEDVILSGRVSFPKSTIEGTPHQVQSLTLNMHHAIPSRVAPSRVIDMWNLRLIQNSAVIQPDGQGYGVDLDKDFYCSTMGHALAIQMKDCAMAALEVMRQHGVTLAEDGYSIGTACSLSSCEPLAFAKWYETEAPESFRNAIRLKAIYTGFGPTDPVRTLKYLSSHPTFNAALSKFLICSLQAFSSEQLGGYQPSDFASNVLLNTMVEYDGRQMTYFEEEGRYMANFLGTEDWPNPTKLSEILAADMLTADGQMDESSPKTKAMLDALRKENDLSNWNPSLPVYIMHSKQDDRIPWEHAYQCYQELSRWGSNRNVHFVTTELPAVVGGIIQLADMGLGHGLPIMLNFLPAYLEEDPGVAIEGK